MPLLELLTTYGLKYGVLIKRKLICSMRGMETAGERTLHESSSLSSASAKEAMNCETDLEKDNTVTYKNDESAKS